MSVGIVVVSHSEQLAAGVTEVAGQMTQLAVPLAAAGGTPEGKLGTSVERIIEAIRTVDNPAGVLVLLDLGSALLSTEMALEVLSEELHGPIRLSTAPILEGAVAAALEAALGRSLADVKTAAENAASLEQLRLLKPINTSVASNQTGTSGTDQTTSSSTWLERRLLLRNPSGLHARPAALLVQTAGQFHAQVRLQLRGREVDATSIMQALSLAAHQGEKLIIRANGTDAEAAITALAALVEAQFYEAHGQPQEIPAQSVSPKQILQEAPDTWHGVSTSQGIALAPAFLFLPQQPILTNITPQSIKPEQIKTEQERLDQALEDVALQLTELAVQARISKSEGAIFEAQAMMLRDPAFLTETQKRISQQTIDAAGALALVAEQWATTFEQTEDTLIAARALDVRDAVSQVVGRLRRTNHDTPSLDLSGIKEPVILLADQLTPSDMAHLQTHAVAGICTIRGGTTDHVAILAQGMSIPSITGIDASALTAIHNGEMLGLDAEQGILYRQPAAPLRTKLQHRLQARQKRLAHQASLQSSPLFFRDQHITLLANVGHESEAEAARKWGAEGIGLVRTELLFSALATYPDETEQRQIYARIFQAFGTHRPEPVVVRTLDIGADKPLPSLESFLKIAPEANPALGLRGLRLHLAHPELLEQQIRALLLAATDTGTALQIMFPLVTSLEEMQQARTLFTRVYQELQKQTTGLPEPVPAGAMVEVPAAALLTEELATAADFFSIGVNDLTQYTLACDRGNTAVASLYNPAHPAVLRLIRQIAQAGQRTGRSVAVCGAIAGDARFAPLLIGLGIHELSVTPSALPTLRSTLAHTLKKDLIDLAETACRLKTADEVEQLCLKALH